MQYVVDLVEKSEKIAARIAQDIKDYFSRNEKIILLYCGAARGLATYIGSILKVSRPSLNIIVLDAEYCHNIVVPYIAEDMDGAVVVSSLTDFRCVYRIMQSVLSVGLNTLMILPTVTVSLVRERVTLSAERLKVVEIESDIYRMAVLQIFLRIALDIGGRRVARIRRIEKELELGSIVEELVERYSRELSMCRDTKHVLVSKALTVVGEELADRGLNVSVIGEKLYSTKFEAPLLLIYTTTEEHTVGEFVIEMVKSGIKRSDIVDLRVNADPFTAPVYSLILVHSILRRRESNDKLKASECKSVVNTTTGSVPG